MSKEVEIDLFQKQLGEGRRHCLVSLLDYADAEKRQSKDAEESKRIERLKKRIHNDIAQFYQTASNLLELMKRGGKIIPFGRTDAESRDKNNSTGKNGTGKLKKKVVSSDSPKPESGN